jgi:hypothetical protein
MEEEPPGALLARRPRTVKLCSFDARSWDHPSHPLKMDSSLRPCWEEFFSILRNNSSTLYLQITLIFKPIAT